MLRMEDYLQTIEPYTSLGMQFLECTGTSASIKIRLQGNMNDKKTMFAGSIYSIMVLTGWTLAKQICLGRKTDYDVVIGKSSTSFLQPVKTDCIARAEFIADPLEKTNGNISTEIKVELLDKEGVKCAELKGKYIGIPKVPADQTQ